MIILSCDQITKSFGDVTILDQVTFSVNEGERMGVVGANGAGKSTLIKLIHGDFHVDDGAIYKPKDISIGYLAQNDPVNSHSTIWEELLLVFEPLIKIEERLKELEHEMGAFENIEDSQYEKILDEYSALRETFEAQDGYSYQSFIRGILSGLGFSSDNYYQPINQLSGGQKTRIALAKLLLVQPNLLLLDEPTNYLDLDAAQWLEDYLKSYPGTIIMVSHDRYFLDHLCTAILEIENNKAFLYEGSYSTFKEKKKARIEQQDKKFQLQRKEITRQQAIIERYKSFNREKSIKAAESRQKALDKIELVEKSYIQDEIKIAFDVDKQSGRDVLAVEGISKSFGDLLLFDGVSFSLRYGERAAIIGPNGSGKSTILKIILDQMSPSSGDIKLGTGVSIGYYDQEQDSLSSENTALDEIWNNFPQLTHTQVRNMLASFLFKGDDVFKPVHNLSGGERSRLLLIKLMLEKNNFLILDEPTNHLDMDSKEKLEEALSEYLGTILVVSHDRYFINKIANKIIVLEEKGIKEYLGNYDDYIEKKKGLMYQSESESSQAKTRTALKEERKREREEKLRQQEKQQFLADAEEFIHKLENKIQLLEKKMCDPSLYDDVDKMIEIQKEYEQTKTTLDEAYAHWLENSI